MRPGCYDIHARVADMDLGHLGDAQFSLDDPGSADGIRPTPRTLKWEGLGAGVERLAVTEWFQAYPDRIIPCGIVYLSDPAAAADEIRATPPADSLP